MSQLPETAQKYVYTGFDINAEQPKNPDWLKAAIVLQAVALKEPKVTWKRWVQLRKYSPAADVDAFKTDLNALIHPHILGRHGYYRGLQSHDQQAIWQGVREITDMFADMGVPAFVNSGALLGLIREGALLPHDDDIDIGIVLPGTTAEDAAQSNIDLMERLGPKVNWRFTFRNPKASEVFIKLKNIRLKRETKIESDVFPGWVEGDKFFAYPHGTISVDQVLPLAEREIEGVKVPVPADPEAFLELCYGPGWRTPDDAYVYPWARAKATFETFRLSQRTKLKPYEAKFRAAPGKIPTK